VIRKASAVIRTQLQQIALESQDAVRGARGAARRHAVLESLVWLADRHDGRAQEYEVRALRGWIELLRIELSGGDEPTPRRTRSRAHRGGLEILDGGRA
jgi:hypothetical protein